MRRTVLLLLLIFMTASAAPAQAVKADLPLNPGNRWEYKRQDGTVEVLTITDCRQYMNIPVCTVSFNNQEYFYLVPTREGIYRLNFDPASPPIPKDRSMTLLIKSELDNDQMTWSTPWGNRPLLFTVIAVEDITVTAGFISSAYKIGYRPPVNPIYEGFYWYAPGIGIVFQQENEFSSELLSFTRSDLLPPQPADIRGADLALLLGFPPSFREATTSQESDPPTNYLLHVLVVVILLLSAAVTFLTIRRGGKHLDMSGSVGVSDGEILVARSMVRDGLFGEAIEILERLTQKHPDWPDLAAELGKAYLERGMTREASLELKRALTLNPGLVMARVDLAKALLSFGEPAGAMAEAEAVLAENPSYADALYLKGEAVLMLGNSDAARALFEEALILNPHFSQAREALERAKARDQA